jgi:hypothetical protein
MFSQPRVVNYGILCLNLNNVTAPTLPHISEHHGPGSAFCLAHCKLANLANLAVALMILIQESCEKIHGENTNEVGGGVNGNATGMMAAPG